MNNKKVFLVVVVLLAISLITNLYLITYNSVEKKISIVGTYCSGKQELENTEYITFDKNGKYIMYKQFEVLEKGNYSLQKEKVISLESSDNSITNVLMGEGSVIYYIDKMSDIKCLNKISDIPTYININDNIIRQ